MLFVAARKRRDLANLIVAQNWGLCAVGLLFGMAEYKTSPLRKGGERGHLFILLYVGALLIITRALNMFLYGG